MIFQKSPTKLIVLPTILSLLIFIFPVSLFADTKTIYAPDNCESLLSTSLSEDMKAEIDTRIANLSVATSTALNMWTTRGNATSTWIRNPNVWTNNGSTPIDLTGLSPWNATGTYTRAGTLITPRHIALATHYVPFIAVGATIVFIDNNNNIITRTIASSTQVGSTDILIMSLDSDVPAEITTYPILFASDLASHVKSYSSVPVLVTDQEDKALIHDLDPASNLASGYSVAHYNSSDSIRAQFGETLITGDSGNPGMVIIDGKPALILTHTGPTSGPNYTYYRNDVQAAVDALVPGYDIDEYDLSCFESNITPAFATSTYAFDLDENSSNATLVGQVSATDGNESDTISYSIIGGNTSRAFSINSSGEITVATPSAINFETNPTFDLVVRVSDDWASPASSTATVSIATNEIDENPVFGSGSYTFPSNEEVTNGTVLGSVSATDPEGATTTYSIISGNTEGVFSIGSTTGELSVLDNSGIDYETNTSHILVVQAEDSTSNIATSSVTINIANRTEPTASFSVSEIYTEEDDGNVNVTINLSGTTVHPTPLSFLVSGTASNGVDYSFSTTTPTVAAGQTSTSFSVSLVNDSSSENQETVGLLLTAPSTPRRVFVDSSSDELTIFINNISSGGSSGGGGGGGGSRGGGGGSGSTSVNAKKVTIVTNADGTKTVVITPAGSTPPSSVSVSVSTFTRDLSSGTSGEDVRSLQKLLNSKGFLVTTSGPGSTGNETTIFGPATQAALSRFQASLGLPATGYFGQMTRAAISTTVPTTQNSFATSMPQVLSGTTSAFSRDLSSGAVGEDVRSLQELLNSKGFTVSISGPGSTGNETTIFGPATQAALSRFQASLGLPATGYFGQMTRARIN